MQILRRLMAGPATLSHLGSAFDEQPSQIRHHLKLLEKAGLVEMTSTQIVRGFVEKYYQATARAFILQFLALPDSAGRASATVFGSHDLALDLLVEETSTEAGVQALALPVGSLEGLWALRQGMATAAACHLQDAESGEYNIPFIHHFFPDRSMALFTLAHRVQGLMVRPANPKGIGAISDLARPDVVFINRNRGSGTRLWLERELERLGVSRQSIHGFTSEQHTHTAVAQAVLRGEADVGLGIEAAAMAAGLIFIPLFSERFDLATHSQALQEPGLVPLLERLNTARFRQRVKDLIGYDVSHMGDKIEIHNC